MSGYNLRHGFAVLIAFIFAMATGCLPSTKPPCDPVQINKIIEPVKFSNNKVYFDVDDFDFMFKSNVVVQDISLEVSLSEKHKDSDDFSLDLNGTKMARNDGERNLNWNCGSLSLSGNAKSRACSKLHKYTLNGGLGILAFMTLVKLQRGDLRISLHGYSSKVVEARIVINGTEQKGCTNPPTDPPPPATKPVTSISSYIPAESPSNSTSKSITFAADQVGVSYKCSLDGAAATACSSPAVYSGLSNGQHTFTVFATNSAGLSDAQPASLTWLVDAAPPSVTITNAAQLPGLTNSTGLTVQFTSNEAATYSCKLDSAAAEACTSPYVLSGLTEGEHTLAITAVDSVGNVSASPAMHSWVIDVTAPVSTINAVTPSAAINNSAEFSVQFSSNETSTFECSVDNGAYATCASPFAMSNVIEGSHFFSVRATDAAGNVGLPASYSWKTDVTAPVITVVSSLPASGSTNAHSVLVNFDLSEIATAKCSFDGAEAIECTSPFSADIVQAGAHSLVITASDSAGNQAVPMQIGWMMDFSIPELSFGAIAPSSANINVDSISLEINSSEPASLTASVNGSAANSISSPFVLSNLAEGSYTIVVNGTDSVGNPAQPITYSFNVDMTIPQATVQAAITGLTRMDSNVLTMTSSETADFTCNIDEAGFGPCVSPLNLAGLADGVHDVRVRATDAAGNVSPEVSVQWTVDTTAPGTSLAMQQNSKNSFTFTFSSNEEGATFQCSVDSATTQTCTSPVTVTNLGLGAHSFFVQSVDLAGNVDANGAIMNFSVTPPTTMISYVQNANDNFTFTFTSDDPTANFLCALDGAAATSCFSPRTLSGLSVGNHTLVVRAVDRAGNVDPVGASQTVTVNQPITTNLLSQSPSAAFTNQKSITFTFSASQTGASFVCALNGGVAVPCASPVSYSNLNDGLRSFKVQAIDQWGNPDPVGASYSWTVDTTAPGLVTISTSSTSTTVDVSWTTNEPSTTKLFWGPSPDTSRVITETSVYVTNHSVRLTGLSPNTVYTLKPAGTDRAGNVFVGGTVTARTGR